MRVNRRDRRTLALSLVVVGVTAGIALRLAGPPATASTPTTTIAPTTTRAPATTTIAPTTAAPLPSLPEPESEESDPVRTLLPSIVAVAEELATPEQSQVVIDAALTERRRDIAVEERPATLCAVVPVLAPLTGAGRWERDGEPIASSSEQRRDPPGFGECIPSDGDPIDEGVYQYIVVGPTGATSSAATLVVGVAATQVRLLHNGDEPVCLLLVSPREADFYEAFDAETPLLPGEGIALNVADTELDVRVFGCAGDGSVGDSLRTFRVTTGEPAYVPLFADTAAPGGSGPTTTTTATTAATATTAITTTTAA